MKYYKISEEDLKHVKDICGIVFHDWFKEEHNIKPLPELTDEMIEEMATEKAGLDFKRLNSNRNKDRSYTYYLGLKNGMKAAREYFTKE